jgi:hypothetical protein
MCTRATWRGGFFLRDCFTTLALDELMETARCAVLGATEFGKFR